MEGKSEGSKWNLTTRVGYYLSKTKEANGAKTR